MGAIEQIHPFALSLSKGGSQMGKGIARPIHYEPLSRMFRGSLRYGCDRQWNWQSLHGNRHYGSDTTRSLLAAS